MTDAKTAWDEVGRSFGGLGLKLKYHFEQARGDEAEADEVKDAIRRLADTIDDALDAVGAASKDDAVREDVRQVGEALAGALSVTFTEMGDEVRRAFRRTRGESDEPSS